MTTDRRAQRGESPERFKPPEFRSRSARFAGVAQLADVEALASGSGSGRGAAEDAASLDPLDPAFLYRPSRRR